MRVRTIYSASRNIMLRGNSEVDYEVFKVLHGADGEGVTERVGKAWDSWSTHKPWKFKLTGEVANKCSAPTLRQLVELIEAEFT